MSNPTDDGDNSNLDAIVAPFDAGDPTLLNAMPVSTIRIAETIYDPIPPLREVRAKLIKVGESGLSEADADAEKNSVLLEDPDGYAVQTALLSTWAYMLALLFDGRRNAIQAAEAFREKYNHAIQPEQALVLQHELEQAMFLNSASFEEQLNQRLNGYLEMRSWAATHAGTSYPSAPMALAETISSFFSAPDGPGALSDVVQKPTDTVRAVIVPHVDLRTGGATYAHGYKQLMEASQAEVIFVLGISHHYTGDQLFSVSQKDFETPLGIVRNAREISKRMHVASQSDDMAAEMAHRGEFSIEFQAALIQALLVERCKRSIEIVPILCGSVDPFLSRDANPFRDEEFMRFTNALRSELDNCGRKWCILCSVDFSHVGPEFGHSSMIDERLLKPIERMDMKSLRLIEKLDAEGFYNEIARSQNSRHVDAVLAVLAMLSASQGLLGSGRLLHYDQMLKANSHSAVSYAAMSFEQADHVV